MSITDQTVELIGYGSTLRALTNGIVALAVAGASGTVGAYGLTITASSGGIDCNGSTSGSTLRVRLVDAIVSDMNDIGIVAYRCDIVMSRSRVTNADGGGLDLTQAGFDITNSVIDSNGPEANFGGIQLTNPRVDPARLAFNTIVDNDSGGATAPGIACTSGVALPPFHSNIITDNTGGSTQVSGVTNCSYEFSLINPPFAGDENVSGDPALDATFHIPADSPAREEGKPASGITEDFDRQPRDDTPDIGADEVAPGG